MAVTETQRHDLHDYFQETMGRERAAVLMELLPPVGWGDVATKQDLGILKKELTAELAIMRNNLKADIVDRMNTQLLGYFGLNVGLYGVTVGLLTLLR